LLAGPVHAGARDGVWRETERRAWAVLRGLQASAAGKKAKRSAKSMVGARMAMDCQGDTLMNARDISEDFAEFRPTKTSPVKPCEQPFLGGLS
jgi:hypothetical protein